MSSISMHMKNLVKIHQSFPKIWCGKENVMDGRIRGGGGNKNAGWDKQGCGVGHVYKAGGD